MSDEHRSTGMLALLAPAVICIVALAVSYKAFQAARSAQDGSAVAALRADLDGLRGQLASLSNTLAAVAQRPTAVIAGGTSANEDLSMAGSLVALESSVSRIEKTLDKTGLEGVATNGLDQGTLKEIVDERVEQKQVEIKRDQLEKLRDSQRTADIAKYGDDLTNLLALSRAGFGRGRGDNNELTPEQRDAALKELQQKYPEAYGTALALAERAMGSMMRQKPEEVEQYYKQLGDMKQSPDVVTDWGMQAMPSIQYYLANQYIDQKRYGDAEKMISSLEKQYADGLIPNMLAGGGRGRRGDHGGHGFGYTPVSRAVSNLRQKMQNQ